MELGQRIEDLRREVASASAEGAKISKVAPTRSRGDTSRQRRSGVIRSRWAHQATGHLKTIDMQGKT
jgi:hypothetical protein